MKYIAIVNIGGYKVGDEVPQEKAKLWLDMYKEASVEEVEETSSPKVEPKEDDLSPDEPKAESVNAMHDDYINRNADVVVKAIKNDKLNKETLDSLLKLESADKKRKPVVNAIKSKIKALN